MRSAFHQAPNKNKLQVRFFRPSCSLFLLWVQLAAHSDTRLTAVIAGKQCQGVYCKYCSFERCYCTLPIFVPIFSAIFQKRFHSDVMTDFIQNCIIELIKYLLWGIFHERCRMRVSRIYAGCKQTLYYPCISAEL